MLSGLQKAKEKWRNTDLALECLNQDIGGFREHEIKYLRKQISQLSEEGSTAYNSLLDLRLACIQRIHNAMIRRSKRLRYNFLPHFKMPSILRAKRTRPFPEDQEISSKADYVMNLYAGNGDKVLDTVLTRLHELPKMENLQLVEDQMEEDKEASEDDPTQLQQETMQIDEQPNVPSGDHFEKGLLYFLLNAVMIETKSSLKLSKDSPIPDGNVSVIPSPSLRLIQGLRFGHHYNNW